MSKKISYSQYLNLEKILNSQDLISLKNNKPIHDEMLFIIIHQVYELWFKQIIHELDSIISYLKNPNVNESNINIIVIRLERINSIQKLANGQIEILQTMTPMDFLEFRDLLNPASGFQSQQFRIIENALGLKSNQRLKFNKLNYTKFLSKNEKELVEKYENQKNVFDLVEKWLERTPFLETDDFSFWDSYEKSIHKMLENDISIIKKNTQIDNAAKNEQIDNYKKIYNDFELLLNEKKYEDSIQKGYRSLSQKATLAALFIMLYRHEPILQSPYRLITKLIDIDQSLNVWRYNHALLAQRMIGTKIGSGGSSGFKYLSKTLEKHSIFGEYANLSTYLIPKSDMPKLPNDLINKLGYHFTGQEKKNEQ